MVAGRQPAQPQFLIDLRAGTVDQDEADAEAVQQREVPKEPVHVVARTDLTWNHHDERGAAARSAATKSSPVVTRRSGRGWSAAEDTPRSVVTGR